MEHTYSTVRNYDNLGDRHRIESALWEFAKRFRDARKAEGWGEDEGTQDLAYGRVNPTLEDIVYYAALYGVSPAWLAGFDDDPKSKNERLTAWYGARTPELVVLEDLVP